MKLKEIITEKDIKTVSGDTEANFYKISQNKSGLNVLGQGVQGSAFAHSKIPGAVIKTAKIRNSNPEKDGYVRFIKLALAHQDNPFFPKIYNAVLRKLKSTQTGNPYELVVQMERLHRLQSDKLRDITPALFSRLGFDIEPSEVRRWLDNFDNRDYLMKNTKNPKFKEALQLLEPMIQEFKYQDLHLNNWMIRLTSAGPQLVIIDPFYQVGSFE